MHNQPNLSDKINKVISISDNINNIIKIYGIEKTIETILESTDQLADNATLRDDKIKSLYWRQISIILFDCLRKIKEKYQ